MILGTSAQQLQSAGSYVNDECLSGCEVFLYRLPLTNSLRSLTTDKAPKFPILHTLTVLHCISLQSGIILQHSASLRRKAISLGGQRLMKAPTSIGGPSVQEAEGGSSRSSSVEWGSKPMAAIHVCL